MGSPGWSVRQLSVAEADVEEVTDRGCLLATLSTVGQQAFPYKAIWTAYLHIFCRVQTNLQSPGSRQIMPMSEIG